MHEHPHNYYEEVRFTDNPTVHWKARRFKLLSCGYCAPHRGENQHGRIPRHDRYKSVRKGRCSGNPNPPWRDSGLDRPYRSNRPGAPSKMWRRDVDRLKSFYTSDESILKMAANGVKNYLTYWLPKEKSPE